MTRDITKEENDSVCLANAIESENIREVLLEQLKEERRRNDRLENEKKQLKKVDWYKFFFFTVLAVVVGNMLYHSIRIVVWPS